MYEPLSIPILISIGVAFVGLEMLTGTFYIFWFAIGFFAVAIVEYFSPFPSALYQISLALVISLLLLIVLKKKVDLLHKRSEKVIKDDFLNEAGEGIIKEGMVFYKGTLWEYEPKNLHVNNGLRVKILSTKGNVATIEPIKEDEAI